MDDDYNENPDDWDDWMKNYEHPDSTKIGWVIKR